MNIWTKKVLVCLKVPKSGLNCEAFKYLVPKMFLCNVSKKKHFSRAKFDPTTYKKPKKNPKKYSKRFFSLTKIERIGF